MYVSISEETAIKVIEDLEEKIAFRDKALDARWDEISALANQTRELRDENARLREQNYAPVRECRLQHYPFSKISAIKLVRNVTGLGLKEAKDMVDAAIAAGKISL